MPPNPRLRHPLLAVALTLILIILYHSLGGSTETRLSQLFVDRNEGQHLSGYRPTKQDVEKVEETHRDGSTRPPSEAVLEPLTSQLSTSTSSNTPPPPSASVSPGETEQSITTSSESTSTASESTSTALSTEPAAKPAAEPQPEEQPPAKARNAIVSAVWDANYASFALMLGWSLQQHNNLTKLDAELVLLTLDHPTKASAGITAENRTRLEKVGWKVRTADKLNIPGVNMDKIVRHRRLNLNKLQQFGWEEYGKIVYIDADAVCKSSIEDLFSMPGEFAAAPDVWFDIPIDSRSNSGVMVFKPSKKLFDDMMAKLPQMHNPHEGDQNFLQKYWKYRDYKLPFKYNLNIVMHEHYRDTFNWLWDEAAIVHYTVHKPVQDPAKWCRSPESSEPHKDCVLWPILEWYRAYFIVMLQATGFEGEIPILG